MVPFVLAKVIKKILNTEEAMFLVAKYICLEQQTLARKKKIKRKQLRKYCLHDILNAKYKSNAKLESVLGKWGYHGNGV